MTRNSNGRRRWAAALGQAGDRHPRRGQDLPSSRACFEPLAELGYLYAPYRVDEMDWFWKPNPARRTRHLHLVPTGSDRYRNELTFRDALRAQPQLAEEYAALKRALAGRYEHDRERYTDAKAPFIERVLAESRGRGT